jgi:phytoene dehydrogenase-like protein
VLGGGIGGLVTAAKLAQSGYSVTVCEQNDQLGGRCQTVSFENCRFDTGPSLLLLPQVYRDTFAWLGSSITEHVQLARVEPAAYRVWFADGFDSSSSSSSSSSGTQQDATLDLFYDVQRMVEQLERVEPGAGGGFVAAGVRNSASKHNNRPRAGRLSAVRNHVPPFLLMLHKTHNQLGSIGPCSCTEC